MTFEEMKRLGIAEANKLRGTLDKDPELLGAFKTWWRSRDPQLRELQPGDEASQALASTLRALGCTAAADYALDPVLKEGPIHPGTWLYSTLLGESRAALYVDGLGTQDPAEIHFYGSDGFGTWDAFKHSLAERLRQNKSSAATAMARLKAVFAEINADPKQFIDFPGRVRGAELNLRFQSEPNIDDVWDDRKEFIVDVPELVLLSPMLELNPAETLLLLSGLPDPSLARNLLFHFALKGQPNEFSSLVQASPLAFREGRFLSAGMVVVCLLEHARTELCRFSLDDKGTFRTAPVDHPEELSDQVKQCEAAMTRILDALFQRADGVDLAWAWLERIVTSGKVRGKWDTSAKDDRVSVFNAPMLQIQALSARLTWRSDWQEWLGARQQLWRIYRAASIMAVGAFGSDANPNRLADAFTQMLLNGDLQYGGTEGALPDSLNTVAVLGGQVILMQGDCAGWFESVWDRIRPVRERDWRLPQNSSNSAQLLMLWGLASHRLATDQVRPKLWVALEHAARDAWQTETLGHVAFWSKVLRLLFSAFDSGHDHSDPRAAQALGQLLQPYIAPTHGFVMVVIALTETGWSHEIIQRALDITGISLKELVRQFIDMKGELLRSHLTNQNEMEQIKALQERLG